MYNQRGGMPPRGPRWGPPGGYRGGGFRGRGGPRGPWMPRGGRQCGAVPHAEGIITVPRVNHLDPALPHHMYLFSTFPLILSFVSNLFHVLNPNSVKELDFLLQLFDFGQTIL